MHPKPLLEFKLLPCFTSNGDIQFTAAAHLNSPYLITTFEYIMNGKWFWKPDTTTDLSI